MGAPQNWGTPTDGKDVDTTKELWGGEARKQFQHLRIFGLHKTYTGLSWECKRFTGLQLQFCLSRSSAGT